VSNSARPVVHRDRSPAARDAARRTSYGAMSETSLATVNRVVRIVREIGCVRSVGAGARGTERRRKPPEMLESGAGMALARSLLAEEDRREAAAEADTIPDWRFLADLAPQREEDGTEWRRNPLKSLDSRAERTRIASLLAAEGRGEEAVAEAAAERN
jgi:hypothetical protein